VVLEQISGAVFASVNRGGFRDMLTVVHGNSRDLFLDRGDHSPHGREDFNREIEAGEEFSLENQGCRMSDALFIEPPA
jgi:hypothetical protein